MISRLIVLFDKLIHPHTCSSASFVKYLKKTGVIIGDNTVFVAPKRIVVDAGRREYITIGDNCVITEGVKILAHDYSWSLLSVSHNEILPDPGKKVIIGNNVFIGVNATIIGATIGDNTIIGANSFVSGNLEGGYVYAGCPAKKICSLEDYYRKRKDRQIEDAFFRARFIKEKRNRYPTIEEMGWFAVLFLERTQQNQDYLSKLSFVGKNKEHIVAIFMNTTPLFNGFDDFINCCFGGLKNG